MMRTREILPAVFKHLSLIPSILSSGTSLLNYIRTRVEKITPLVVDGDSSA